MWMSFVIASTLLAAPAPDARARTMCDYCHWQYLVPTVVFETTLTNVLTVDPAGRGETLEANGITLRLQLVCTETSPLEPLVGIESIVLFSPDLALCIPMFAAQPTDANGWTEFHGTFQAGGCVDHLLLYAEGIFIAEIPLRFNSPDTGTASPGRVDAADLAVLATHFGRPERYSICFDFNEDGSIDSGDLAYFAAVLGSGCP